MPSFQSQMRDNFCWGCGQDNHDGLRLESEWDGAAAVAGPGPRSAAVHAAGPRHLLNGGIVATVIDCHGICTAVADARLHRRAGREIGTEPLIWYATTGLHVEYLAAHPDRRRAHAARHGGGGRRAAQRRRLHPPRDREGARPGPGRGRPGAGGVAARAGLTGCPPR